MKTLLKLILAGALAVVLWGCEKETPTSGTLAIEFYRSISPQIVIYTIEGDRLFETNKYTIDLNAGNYTVQPIGNGYAFVRCNFQIIAGRTTKVIYGLNDGPTVIME